MYVKEQFRSQIEEEIQALNPRLKKSLNSVCTHVWNNGGISEITSF